MRVLMMPGKAAVKSGDIKVQQKLKKKNEEIDG
jgi:hypothetical protein